MRWQSFNNQAHKLNPIVPAELKEKASSSLENLRRIQTASFTLKISRQIQIQNAPLPNNH
jgi:hypothetical protein